MSGSLGNEWNKLKSFKQTYGFHSLDTIAIPRDRELSFFFFINLNERSTITTFNYVVFLNIPSFLQHKLKTHEPSIVSPLFCFVLFVTFSLVRTRESLSKTITFGTNRRIGVDRIKPWFYFNPCVRKNCAAPDSDLTIL